MAPDRRKGAQTTLLEERDMYMTTDEMTDSLYSPIRRLRMELGDPTVGRQSDDAWLNNELRNACWRFENARRERRRRRAR